MNVLADPGLSCNPFPCCVSGFLFLYYCTMQIFFVYSKCPKISHTKVNDKMAYANSADPVQTAPEGAV